jgi:hypothetical protein
MSVDPGQRYTPVSGCYNRAVVTGDLRRVVLLTLLAVVAIAIVLSVAPRHLAAVRVGGVSLLWWYATLAPLVAGTAVAALLWRARSGGLRGPQDE